MSNVVPNSLKDFSVYCSTHSVETVELFRPFYTTKCATKYKIVNTATRPLLPCFRSNQPTKSVRLRQTDERASRHLCAGLHTRVLSLSLALSLRLPTSHRHRHRSPSLIEAAILFGIVAVCTPQSEHTSVRFSLVTHTHSKLLCRAPNLTHPYPNDLVRVCLSACARPTFAPPHPPASKPDLSGDRCEYV